MTLFFLYLSGSVICRRVTERKRVIIVAKNVMNERIKGKIGLVLPHSSRACWNVSGILMIPDVANTIINIRILPINPAMSAPSELIAIS